MLMVLEYVFQAVSPLHVTFLLQNGRCNLQQQLQIALVKPKGIHNRTLTYSQYCHKGGKKSSYLWRGKSFHSKVSPTQHETAGRVITILEVELQPQISRKITWVLLALLTVSPTSKLALSTAVKRHREQQQNQSGRIQLGLLCASSGDLWETEAAAEQSTDKTQKKLQNHRSEHSSPPTATRECRLAPTPKKLPELCQHSHAYSQTPFHHSFPVQIYYEQYFLLREEPGLYIYFFTS